MLFYNYLIFFVLIVLSCQAQNRQVKSSTIVGGPCEGCEAIFEYGSQHLKALDTLPYFEETEPKLKLTGTVFQNDGMTPAENVILYIYHTDRQGIYPTQGQEEGWGRRHGYLRGWIKTGKDGKYTFFTFRPASYPDGQEPEHIHITVKEPNYNEYYIDEWVFEDDPMLTTDIRNKLNNRGGSGIVNPVFDGDIFIINRDIILGLNIPNYE